MHAVDTVHVGVARRAVHHLVASGHAEAGVRGGVVRPAVRLHLHDPRDPHAGRVIADKATAQQRPRGIRDRESQNVPVKDRQADVPG